MTTITHRCPSDGKAREITADWKPLPEELRGVCPHCDAIVYGNENGVEHA